MIEIPRTFYIYHRNNIAELSGPPYVDGSSMDYINEPMLELCTYFKDNEVTINGSFETTIVVDSFCIGNTNATKYKLNIGKAKKKKSGKIDKLITIYNFEKSFFADSFELTLTGPDPIYLGHLFFGEKTCLPRFSIEPDTGIELRSESNRSFGGQAFGMRRKPLSNFSVNFPWLTAEDKNLIVNYVETVLNVEPHIVDPYSQAREDFPPFYATLSIGELSLPKLNENGFYYSGSLSWQEAK